MYDNWETSKKLGLLLKISNEKPIIQTVCFLHNEHYIISKAIVKEVN